MERAVGHGARVAVARSANRAQFRANRGVRKMMLADHRSGDSRHVDALASNIVGDESQPRNSASFQFVMVISSCGNKLLVRGTHIRRPICDGHQHDEWYLPLRIADRGADSRGHLEWAAFVRGPVQMGKNK